MHYLIPITYKKNFRFHHKKVWGSLMLTPKMCFYIVENWELQNSSMANRWAYFMHG